MGKIRKEYGCIGIVQTFDKETKELLETDFDIEDWTTWDPESGKDLSEEEADKYDAPFMGDGVKDRLHKYESIVNYIQRRLDVAIKSHKEAIAKGTDTRTMWKFAAYEDIKKLVDDLLSLGVEGYKEKYPINIDESGT